MVKPKFFSLHYRWLSLPPSKRQKAAATPQQPTAQTTSREEPTDDYAAFSAEKSAKPPLETFTLKFKEIFLFSLTDFSVFTLVLVIGYNVIDNIPNLFAYASELQQLGLLLGAALLLRLLILFSSLRSPEIFSVIMALR